MKKRLLIISLFLPLIISFSADKDIIINKEEAQKAFILLNKVRLNQQDYYRDFQFEKNLSVTKKLLVWNDTLAKVAEARAYDMANRNYFSHVNPDGYGVNYYINKSGYSLNRDWLKTKNLNYFESLAAGSIDGEDAIRQLIIDEDDAKNGYRHRIHLLGLDEWSSSLTDIGIGFVSRESGSEYQTYICVIIAKHNW